MCFDMPCDAVEDQVADDRKEALRRLPEKRTGRVLFGLIPLRCDEEKAWGDGALKEALQSTERHHLRPILSCTYADETCGCSGVSNQLQRTRNE